MKLNLGMSAKSFLQEHWQQKPLLIRKAIENWTDPITAEELAGIACEDDADVRWIEGPYSDPGQPKWEVREGPFEERDFKEAIATNWTFLVQEVDQWSDEVREIRRLFGFLPEWRMDDVMVSFGNLNGTAGPHLDHYDVFLIQGEGRKRWQIEKEPRKNESWIEGEAIRVLSDFQPDQEWELEAGDILYLPPQWAHYGVSLTDRCLTYSMGFRTPATHQLFDTYSNHLTAIGEEIDRFSDPKRNLPPDPYRISNEDVDRTWDLMKAQLAERDAVLEVLGSNVTAPKRSDSDYHGEISEEELSSSHWKLDPSARVAYFLRESGEEIELFLNGGSIRVPAEVLEALLESLKTERLEPSYGNDSWDALRLELCRFGIFYPIRDPEESEENQ